MSRNDSENLNIAMMLLEMGSGEGMMHPSYPEPWQYMSAAHSYLQAMDGGPHSWDGAVAMVTHIMREAGLDDAVPMSMH